MSFTPESLAELAEQVAALTTRVQQLEDEREISRLLALYGFLVDLPLEDRWVDLFTEDGVMDARFGNDAYPDMAGNIVGHEALREFINDPAGRRRPSHYGRTMHMQSNNETIYIDGDEAIANGYSWVAHRDADGRVSITTAGANEWALRKVDGRWKIARRSRRDVGDTANAELLERTIVDAHPVPEK